MDGAVRLGAACGEEINMIWWVILIVLLLVAFFLVRRIIRKVKWEVEAYEHNKVAK